LPNENNKKPKLKWDGTKIAVDITDTTTWDRCIMTMNVDGTQKNPFEQKLVGKDMGDWAKIVK
jgi:hypothetical protein